MAPKKRARSGEMGGAINFPQGEMFSTNEELGTLQKVVQMKKNIYGLTIWETTKNKSAISLTF